MEALLAWVETLAGNSTTLFAVLFVLGFAHIFVPPIPMETLALAGGVLSGAGHGNPVVIWLGSSLGMALGSTVLFQLAAIHGRKILQHRLVARQLPGSSVERIQSWLDHFGLWTVFLGKFIPGMTFATVLCCGLFGLKKGKALPAIYGANLLYFGGVVLVGRYVGHDWRRILALSASLTWTLLAVVTVAAVIVGVWLAAHKAQDEGR